MLHQEFSWRFLPKFAALLLSVLILSMSPGHAGEGLSKNIVVLVDVSKSVDIGNQSSALKLVAGLVSGKLDGESLQNWKFQSSLDRTLPAVINLERLGDGGDALCEPLASAEAKFVVSPLGNYARVAALREALSIPRTGSPESLVEALIHPTPPFGSTDNSTHLTLAQSVVANTFLQTDSQTPYYLIVISDFNEDCLNSEISIYDSKSKPKEFDELKKKNAQVLRGEMDYNDGAGENKSYTPQDVEGIRFFSDKIHDLQIGSFVYQGSVQTGRLPVHVRIYSPTVKKKLAFAKAAEGAWVVPDPAPSLPVVSEGLGLNAPLRITFSTADKKDSVILKETCSFIMATGQLDLDQLFGKPELARFLNPGSYRVSLHVDQDIGLAIVDETSFEIAVPSISTLDPAMDSDIVIDGKPPESPYVFPPNKMVRDEKITYRIEPAPQKNHKLMIRCGSVSQSVEIINGRAEAKLGELLKESSGGNDPVLVTASLRIPTAAGSVSKEVWMLLPQISIWAEYAGKRIADKETVTLSEGLGLPLKANLVSMKNMDWEETKIVSSDGTTVVSDSPDSLDFSTLPSGNYTVTAKFGSGDSYETATIGVIVPKRIPWMLVVLGSMALVSIGLFAYHFMRR